MAQANNAGAPGEAKGVMPDPIARLNSALEGRYQIERKLGEGGMATVYLAADLSLLGSSVALRPASIER